MGNERNAEAIQQELEAAQEELWALEVEQGHLDEKKREAVESDQRERLMAARKGGKIRAALSRRRSKVAEIEDRREELPYEIHAAQVRVAEVRKEHAEALLPEKERQVEETHKALRPADEEFRKAEAKHRAVHDEYGSALAERGMVAQQKRDAELELERLNRIGPEVSVTLPQSPNAT